MTKFTKIALASAIGLLFVGCSSSPEDVVHGAIESMKTGNLEELRNNCDDDLVKEMTGVMEYACDLSRSDFKSDEERLSACFKNIYESFDIKEINIYDDYDTVKEAKVTVSDNGKELLFDVKLAKQDGRWIMVAK